MALRVGASGESSLSIEIGGVWGRRLVSTNEASCRMRSTPNFRTACSRSQPS